jgi:CotH kinase protein
MRPSKPSTTFERPTSKLLVFITIVIIASVSACKTWFRSSSSAPPITEIHLRLDPSDIAMMKSELFTKRSVIGELDLHTTNGHQVHRVEVSYAGQSSILSPKKGYKIKFLSGDYQGINRWRLHGQIRDRSGLRTYLGGKIFSAEGFAVARSEPVKLRLNSEDHGLYLLAESIDQDFYRRRGLNVTTLYKGELAQADFSNKNLNRSRPGFAVEVGSDSAEEIHAIIAAVTNHDDAKTTDDSLDKLIDTRLFMRYLAITVYLNHFDGQNNNFYLYRTVNDPMLKITPWDFDRILEEPIPVPPSGMLSGRNAMASWILEDSARAHSFHEDIKRLFASYPPEATASMLQEYADKVAPELARDPFFKELGTESLAELTAKLGRWQEAILKEIERSESTAP